MDNYLTIVKSQLIKLYEDLHHFAIQNVPTQTVACCSNFSEGISSLLYLVGPSDQEQVNRYGGNRLTPLRAFGDSLVTFILRHMLTY